MNVRSIVLAAALICASIVSPASASVIYDNTNGDGYDGTGFGLDVANTSDEVQSIAIPFFSANSAIITSIAAYVGVRGSVTLGIMADAGGLPSGTFLFNQSGVTLSNAHPVDLNSLAWSITGGTTYWLAAVAENGTFSRWENFSDTNGLFAFADGLAGGPWIAFEGALPEARIEATAAVPEPATWAMMFIGFAGIGFMAYRRSRDRCRIIGAA